MAREFAAIIETNHKRAWDSTIITEVLSPFEGPDEFTYTMRLNVPEGKREEIARQLRERGATDLVELLEQHQWDVSFLVDGY